MKKILLALVFLLVLPVWVLAQNKILTTDDLINFKLYPKSLANLQWIGNSDGCSWLANNALVKASVIKGKSGMRDTVLRLADLNKELAKLKVDTIRRFPAVRWNDAASFTFTLKNRLFIYSLTTGTLTQLNEWDEKAENTDIEYEFYRTAYTIDNNLYISAEGKTVVVTAETNKEIVNGSSRVHRSEWGISKGTFWSPGAEMLAFYRMDESMVDDYPLVDISTDIATLSNTKYPMAGKASHQVTVGVYAIKTAKTIFLKTGDPKDQFLTNISWSPDGKYIFIAVLNREQNHMKLNQYAVTDGSFVRTLFEEQHDRYVEPLTPLKFLKKNNSLFLWESRRDGYNHLYLYTIEGKLVRQLTKGNWEVISTLGTDEKETKVYFMASKETPLEDHLYEVSLKDGRTERLSRPFLNHVTYVNKNNGFFIDQANALDIPTSYIVYGRNGLAIDTLLKGENPLKDYSLGKISLLTLKADDGSDLYARLIKPVNFDSTKKYPVIVYVYGGPHSQLVTNTWLGGSNLYLNYLATQGYLVFTLDNRGTSNRGFAFESIIHRQLGTMEMKDQMAGVNYLKKLPYADTTRFAVEGWSYGGFMTISLMLKQPDIFKVGICGGPVIDWKYYEVMYGERYMDTPEENPEGYAGASLLNYANQLKGKLLIIHGTLDATVVWQNSLQFIKQCINENKQVDYFVYPGHEHGVGGKDRLHLYRKQIQYYKDYL